MRIGFIGVGAMGSPIAKNLIRAGKSVRVFNRTAAKVTATLAAGSTGIACTELSEMSDCTIVFTCLALPQHVVAATSGPEGVYQYLKPGTVHIELSTIDPATAHTLAEQAQQLGIEYVQCTLGKTPAHAEKAEETLFIGGNTKVIQNLKDIFAIIGLPNYVGTVSASCAVKLISNLIGMTNLLVLSEGLRIGEAAGLDTAQLITLLQDTGAHSFQMDVRGPWIAADDFGARFALDLALKDVRLGCAMAEEWGLQPQTMLAALHSFKTASDAGYGKEDCNAVYKIVR